MKKNNLFKISLLILVLNVNDIYSDNNFDACLYGQKKRGGIIGGQGVSLYATSGDKNSNECFKLYTNDIGLQAACIYGYNTNLGPLLNDKSQGIVTGNGCNTDPMTSTAEGIEFSGNGTDNCVNYTGVCDYGASIGWALDYKKSSINNLYFYRNSGETGWTGGKILQHIWGSKFKNTYDYDADVTACDGGACKAWGPRNTLQALYNAYIGNAYTNRWSFNGWSDSAIISSSDLQDPVYN